MNDERLKEVQEKAANFILKAGDEALANWKKVRSHAKSDGVDVVTTTDRKIEREFAEFIKKHYPDHGFSGEEFPELKRHAEYVWYIDPIDGTKFYSKQVPLWIVSIALVHESEPILGLIYNPFSKQLYRAAKDNGSYLDDKKISVSNEIDLGKIQLALDMPISNQEIMERKTAIMPAIEWFFSNFYRVRILGSGADGIVWMSQGFFGCYLNLFRTEEKMYDTYTGMIIAREAGATIHKIVLRPGLYHFIMGNKTVVEKLIPIVSKIK